MVCAVLVVVPLANMETAHAQTVTVSPITEYRSAENIQTTLADYFQKVAGLGFSGAVLAVKDGQILLRDGYGWADEKRQIPNTPETIFDIGSITKVFTAVAIMQLEEKGKLKTSDPITKYFREVPSDKSAISLHHLLTHTSGLEHEDFYDQSPEQIRLILRDREKFIHRILSFPPAFKPGERRLYSNFGFSFLAAIVEQLSGKSYEEYLRDNIFKPAGMTSTGYTLPNWNRHRVAHGYNDGPTDFGFRWYKNDNCVAIVLTNKRIRAGSIRRYAMNDLADIVLFDKTPAMPDFAAIDSARLRSLEGTYKLDSGELLQVTAGIASTGGQKRKSILLIGGKGQRAIDLLFSGNQTPGLTKLSLDLNEKTKNYVEALRMNDAVALKSILPEGISPADAVKTWNESARQKGALKAFAVLGT